MIPRLLGEYISDLEGFQRRMEDIRGHHLAKAGLEMALWDLLGLRLGKSLREMLGGLRARVEVGVLGRPAGFAQHVGRKG